MTVLQNGRDHALFPFSALPHRPRLLWPGSARVALSVILYFEHLPYESPAGTVRDPRWKDRRQPDPRAFSWYEYGNRVGIFRILEALDKHGIRATVAANAAACERYPYLVRAFVDRGYEIAARGIDASSMVTSRLNEDEERGILRDAVERMSQTVATRPIGWFGQDFGESTRTPSLLAEMGMEYIGDWPNDDQPFLLNAGPHGEARLVSIPTTCEWDDMRLVWDRRLQMPRYATIVREAFDTLYEDGAATGRFFSLPLHPWLMGSSHRIRYLEEVLDHIMTHDSIWHATAADVSNHMRARGGAAS